jgi:hypothetical protein
MPLCLKMLDGFNFRAIGKRSLEAPRKNKQREKIPRRVGGTYSPPES